MSIYTAKSIPALVRRCILQALSLSIVVAILLTFVYGFVYYYQQEQAHVQRIGNLLANSAATPDGAAVVAKQVDMLLSSDPAIYSVSFYATNEPVSTLDQSLIEQNSKIWQNALFADTVSFSQAVTSNYLAKNSADNQNVLVGYINVILDVHKLRLSWLRLTFPLWLATMLLAMVSLWFILRKLKWPTKDLTEFAKICNLIIEDASCQQLPVVQQRFEFQELSRIKQAFIVVFDRLRLAQQDYNALSDFEQQLYNKDASLEIQRHNFQSMITHELKTSLNAITGGLQLLEDQYLNEEQKDTLAIISKGSQRLESTLEQIIQLNKIDKGHVGIHSIEFKPLEILADLLQEFDTQAKKKDLELVSKVQHTDHTLEGDAQKIRQILCAIIDNAIKFTTQGQITLESQLMHFSESVRWNLKVIDTGIGIDSHFIEDIFVPFFQVDPTNTRAHEGAGIGLPVVKQKLQLIGATVEVSSELGSGSQFSLTFPLRQRQHSKKKQLLGLDIIYYSTADNRVLVEELTRAGAIVIEYQHEELVLEKVATSQVDIIMFGEDIDPDRVAQLALNIRQTETTQRSLLVYWYPQLNQSSSESIAYGLKAAGVDYLHESTRDAKELNKLMKKWLSYM